MARAAAAQVAKHRINNSLLSHSTRATPKRISLATAAIDVDFDKEKMVVFDEAWSTLDHRFWNGSFNGAQPGHALRDEWRPYIAGARTGPELRRDINLLIGELNSSHSGISLPALPAVRTGRLGLRFEREPYEKNGSLIIREIIPLGPASLESSIKVGDKLLARQCRHTCHRADEPRFAARRQGRQAHRA